MTTPLSSRSRWGLAGIALLTGLGGYGVIILWGAVLTGLFGPVEGIGNEQILSGAALLLGALTTTRLFILGLDLDLAFLDLDWPTVSDAGWAFVGVAALLGLSVLVGFFNVPTADHGLTEEVRAAGPAVLWIVVPVAFLAVGPAEELLYRNLVQKTLATGFGDVSAIVGASLVFAIAHTPAYLGSGRTALAGSLFVVFLLSIVLGVVYAQTRNVPAVAFVHGAYDAVTFASLFLDWL